MAEADAGDRAPCPTCGHRPATILLEFTLPGPPLSAQAKNRARLREWKEAIRQAATARWTPDDPIITGPLVLRVTYYFDTTAPDVDNMVKPIQDALAGVVYENDRQIMDSIARKREIRGAYRFRGGSLVLLGAISAGAEFVHVELIAPHLEDVL